MKLKVLPEDFQVDEQIVVTPKATGSFGLYRLSKRSVGTPEAIREISRVWRLSPKQVRYGGLKDRHAVTTQYLTVLNGPKKNQAGRNWKLAYLGQVDEPFSSSSFRGNRFRIVIRDLSKPAVSRLRLQIEQVRQVGVANYFDEQRFGSVSREGRFIAQSLIEGDFERAVKQALTEPYEHDRAGMKAEKQQLLRAWGNWPLLAASLPLGPASRVVRHLVSEPADFRAAFTRLPHELQSLYLSAYQSDLWNRILARYLERNLEAKERCLVRWQRGTLPMARRLPPERLELFRVLELPLPSARLHLAEDDRLFPLYCEVLAANGLTLQQMKIPGLREPFFSKGMRCAFFFPEELTEEKSRDERYPGKWKVTLAFTLPRGCYATMLIKRATAVVR